MVGRILAAQALSSLGTSMSTVALAFMVYQLTGSVLHMGGVMAVSALPLVVTAWIGGAYARPLQRPEHHGGRRRRPGGADLRHALPGPAGRWASSTWWPPDGGLLGLFNPGQIKLVGEMVAPEHLVKANSYLSVSRDGAELMGYLAGGVLVTYVGYTLTFVHRRRELRDVGLAAARAAPRPVPRVGPAPRCGSARRPSRPRCWRACGGSPRCAPTCCWPCSPAAAIMMNVPNSYGLALEMFDRGARVWGRWRSSWPWGSSSAGSSSAGWAAGGQERLRLSSPCWPWPSAWWR